MRFGQTSSGRRDSRFPQISCTPTLHITLALLPNHTQCRKLAHLYVPESSEQNTKEIQVVYYNMTNSQ